MRGPLDIHRRLLAADVPHEIVHLTHRVTSADDLPECIGAPPEVCAVVHVVLADGSPVAVVIPAGRTWSTVAVARAVGAARLRRADPAETSAFTEYSHALVSPLALPHSVPVLLDTALAAAPAVYAPTGQTATAVTLRGQDLAVATRARVSALSCTTGAATAPVFERFTATGA